MDKIKIYNPFLIYTILWCTSLVFYSFGFTNNILDLDSKTLYLILTSIISFAIIYLFFFLIISFNNGEKLKKKTSLKYILYSKLGPFKKILNRILYIWIFFTTLEIFLFGGVPFISVIIQGNYALDYTKFGIPSVHGLLNSLYFTVTTGYFLHYKLTKDKDSRKKLLLLLVWPFLVMSRATLLWVAIEILYIYLLFTKINLKKICSIAFGIVLFIIIFGIIGDKRGEQQEVRFTDNFISNEYKETAKNIPSGFVWVYLYATTPINNLVYNANLTPTYDFSKSFNSLIPSFIRKLIFKGNEKKPLKLYQEAFNVSSYFANYLSDFGHFGANILVGILQIIITIIYFLSKKMKIGSILAYSAIFYAIFTSVFFDNFISLVTFSQILLGFFINKLLYKKNKNYVIE
jgi:oligosaccharide repeat unit polymerase